ncbi:MAG: flippase [Candidatus Woesebacteria bacterium]
MTSKPHSLTEKVLKGSGTVLIFTLLGSPIAYCIRLLYSNTLSIEMFGLFYAALAFFALISTYLDFGLGLSCSYFIPKFIKKKDFESVSRVFMYTQIVEVAVSIIFSVGLFLNAKWLAMYYFKSELSINLISIFCLYLVANSVFTVINALFVGLQDEKFYSSMHMLRLVFILMFSVFFWLYDVKDVVYYAATWMMSTFLVTILYYIAVIRNYPFVFKKFSWNSTLLRTMITYGVPTLITTSLYTFISSTDTVFLTYFHGLKDVGIYNVVFPLATLSGLFLTPINSLILPLISHLMEGEEEKIAHLVQNILRLVPFIGLYFGLFIALFATSIVGTLFGNKWIGLVEIPLIIFSFGYILSPLSNFLVLILSGMGKTAQRLRLSIYVAVLNITLCFVFIPFYGVVGAVIANTLVYIVSVYLFTRIISNSFQLTYSYGFYVKLGLFASGIFLLVKIFHIQPLGFIQIGITGLLYTMIFALFAFTQEVLDAQTMKLLRSGIMRK